MARKRQKSAFKRRVEQLVAEGKVEQAYNLLVSSDWIPRGSGYHDHYPTGLRLYAEIDETRQILVSKSGRYWAWDLPSDQTEEVLAFREKLQVREPPEIADIINGLEGAAWWFRHEAADGRIEHDISEDLVNIRKRVRLAAEIFADKTDLDVEDHQAMRARIQEELAKYEQLLTDRWLELFQVGAVFQIIGGGGLRDDIESLFETVAIYDCRALGPDQDILVREHGSGVFATFDNREVRTLLPVEVEPIYTDDASFVRSHGGGQFPRILTQGADIRETGAVFAYQGEENDPRNGFYETFEVRYIAGSDREEVVITRDHNQPRVVEFAADDLPSVRVLDDMPRRFISRGERSTSVPVLDIEREHEEKVLYPGGLRIDQFRNIWVPYPEDPSMLRASTWSRHAVCQRCGEGWKVSTESLQTHMRTWKAEDYHRDCYTELVAEEEWEFWTEVAAEVGLGELTEADKPGYIDKFPLTPWFNATVGETQFYVGWRFRVGDVRVTFPEPISNNLLVPLFGEHTTKYLDGRYFGKHKPSEEGQTQRFTIHAHTKEKLVVYLKLLVSIARGEA